MAMVSANATYLACLCFRLLTTEKMGLLGWPKVDGREEALKACSSVCTVVLALYLLSAMGGKS